MKKWLLFACLLLPAALVAQFRLRLEVRAPATDSLFVAGSFNQWRPADSSFRLRYQVAGYYSIELRLPPASYSFKFTRGGWDHVETDARGNDRNNREIRLESDTLLQLQVEGWKQGPARSTAGARVHIFDTAFRMKSLGRHRRIWIYLPPGYSESRQRYPVLYMHDGQNLFDARTAYAGEWGVDEFMDSTRYPPCIVVGIDHGGDRRLNEYNPYGMERFGKGEGDAYLRFLVRELKRYVDRHYRTRRDREHTFIAGSSMGGLISFYALLKYPRVFGGAGVFSPAFWMAPAIWDAIPGKGKKVRARVYFTAGKSESETMVPLMMKAFTLLNRVSKSPLRASIRHEGRHTESFWRAEFPLFYAWLVGGDGGVVRGER